MDVAEPGQIDLFDGIGGVMAKPQPKPKKVKKLTVTKVQLEVNKAIREVEERCRVTDGRHECCGTLTASHFFAVGG